jgi:hypothetical protein
VILLSYAEGIDAHSRYCDLYYKPMTIVNDDSRVINKLEASLTDDTKVIIYDHHMFIVQATDLRVNESKTHLEEKKKKIKLCNFNSHI